MSAFVGEGCCVAVVNVVVAARAVFGVKWRCGRTWMTITPARGGLDAAQSLERDL